MSEANKAIVRQFVEEFWNTGDLGAADRMMAADAVIHMPTGEQVDVAGLKAFAAMWRSALPDWHATAEELVAERDTVAERWTACGTHRGPLQGAPATGRQATATGTVYYRIRDERIVEFRGQFDVAGFMQQLGIAGSPAQTTA